MCTIFQLLAITFWRGPSFFFCLSWAFFFKKLSWRSTGWVNLGEVFDRNVNLLTRQLRSEVCQQNSSLYTNQVVWLRMLKLHTQRSKRISIFVSASTNNFFSVATLRYSCFCFVLCWKRRFRSSCFMNDYVKKTCAKEKLQGKQTARTQNKWLLTGERFNFGKIFLFQMANCFTFACQWLFLGQKLCSFLILWYMLSLYVRHDCSQHNCLAIADERYKLSYRTLGDKFCLSEKTTATYGAQKNFLCFTLSFKFTGI